MLGHSLYTELQLYHDGKKSCETMDTKTKSTLTPDQLRAISLLLKTNNLNPKLITPKNADYVMYNYYHIIF